MVRHLNGIKGNNQLENLQYGTAKQNTHDRFAHGTMTFGENSPNSKLTYAEVKEIFEARKNGENPIVIAARYGVSFSTIYRILNGSNWSEFMEQVNQVL